MRLALISIMVSFSMQPALAADETVPLSDRQLLTEKLASNGVLEDGRQLVHLSHVCTLDIEGARYPVVDLRELVQGAVSPRGASRIVVLNSQLSPVRTIKYTSQRPLFCHENRLILYDDLEVDNVGPEGNMLTLSDGGQTIEVGQANPNEFPAPIFLEGRLQ